MTKNILTFNPGPSKLSPEVIRDIQELATDGFLSTSHRSGTFMEVSKQAITGLHEKMGIPAYYKIFYQPSATAAMDTLLRNLVKEHSFHFVHGAFSNLFFQTALKIGLKALSYETKWNLPVTWEKATIPETELIAITHNETSTGLMWPHEELRNLRKKYPNPLLAIDVTSSFGAMKMDWDIADIWFGSVQKCLGLPSGLGFLIVSPRAFEKSKQAKGIASWQSFVSMNEKMELFQTPETPNMFDICLLAKQMARWNLVEIETLLMQKAKLLYEFPNWKPYIEDKAWASPTVACFQVDAEGWHARAKKQGMVLGKGYGPPQR